MNPPIMKVVKAEILKLLDVKVIYLIMDSKWVKPIHVVPKKPGIMLVKNKDDELIPISILSGWRMCVDYRKLKFFTCKDHFPLPFIDQMLEHLTSKSFYCFLDGYSRYTHIVINPEDEEKTTFTRPFNRYVYKRMPFSLCNTPATFRRCMMSNFSEYVERIIKVFMDDFIVYGDSFNKFYFMVEQGIVLEHVVSLHGLEVDKAIIDVIFIIALPFVCEGGSFFSWLYRFLSIFSQRLQYPCVTSSISGIKPQSHVNRKKNRVVNFLYIYINIHGLRINIYQNFDRVPPILEGPKLLTCNLFTLLTVRIS
jgi:hypothetical protein